MTKYKHGIRIGQLARCKACGDDIRWYGSGWAHHTPGVHPARDPHDHDAEPDLSRTWQDDRRAEDAGPRSDLTERARRVAEMATGETAAVIDELRRDNERLRLIVSRLDECDEVIRLRGEVERLTADRGRLTQEYLTTSQCLAAANADIERLTAELAEERRPKSLWEQEDARRKREAAGQ